MPSSFSPYHGPRVADDRLRKLVEEGLTLSEIAKTAGYGHSHTRRRLRRLGLKARKCPIISDKVLKELADGTRSIRQMAEITGGNHGTIESQVKRLGLKVKRSDRSPSPESLKLNMKVAELREQGHTYYAIGDMLGMMHSRARARYEWYKRNVASAKAK